MARQRRGRDVHGILLLDKPPGITSNRALQIVKRLFGAKKAGHTGALDPFATGLLPICFGEATKVSAFLLDADKCYHASARLGEATNTADSEGEVCRTEAIPELSNTSISAVLADFIGQQSQIPPMYSALKQDGKKLYELARKGITVERPAREITIHSLQLDSYQPPLLNFQVCSSKGTYIRVLAEDIAIALGTCAHLINLRRTKAGDFNLDQAVSLETLEQIAAGDHPQDSLDKLLQPVDTALTGFASLKLNPWQTDEISHGRALPLSEFDEKTLSELQNKSLFKIYSESDLGEIYLLGMAKLTDEKLKSVRLFPGLQK